MSNVYPVYDSHMLDIFMQKERAFINHASCIIQGNQNHMQKNMTADPSLRFFFS